MVAVVRPRSHLVENELLVLCEEKLHTGETNEFQLLGEPLRPLFMLRPERCSTERFLVEQCLSEDAVLMRVDHHGEAAGLAATVAVDHDGRLVLEVDECFEDAGDVPEFFPCASGFFDAFHTPLSLAVVAAEAGLHDGGEADKEASVMELLGGLKRPEFRRLHTHRLGSPLLEQPVLRRSEDKRAWVHGLASETLEKLERALVDAFPFAGDDVDEACELEERLLVVIVRDDFLPRDERPAFLLALAVDDRLDAELRSGRGGHAAKLATAEDANGLAHVSRPLYMSAFPKSTIPERYGMVRIKICFDEVKLALYSVAGSACAFVGRRDMPHCHLALRG